MLFRNDDEQNCAARRSTLRAAPVLEMALLLLALSACFGMSDVRADQLSLRYGRPASTERSALPLVVVFDPKELPDELTLAVPQHAPHSRLLGAQSLVTRHLRAALETAFENVSVVDDVKKAPAGALRGTVHFVEAGIAISPGGTSLVGTLEWSLALNQPSRARPFFSWSERSVGTRQGGAGSFGHFDPSTVVQGAIEASLRSLLMELDARGVVANLNGGDVRPR